MIKIIKLIVLITLVSCNCVCIYEHQKAVVIDRTDAQRFVDDRYKFMYLNDSVIKEKILEGDYKIGDTILVERFIKCESIRKKKK